MIQQETTKKKKCLLSGISAYNGVIIGIIAFLVMGVCFHFKLFDTFELITLEWRFKHFHSQAKASDNCIVLGVNNEGLEKLGQWPWSRKVYTKLLKMMDIYGVKSVAFDIYFPIRNNYDMQGDIDFANEIKKHKNVTVTTPIFYLEKKRQKIKEEDKIKQLQKLSITHQGNLKALSADDITSSFLSEKDKGNKNFIISFLTPYQELFTNTKSIGIPSLSPDSFNKIFKVPLLVEFKGNYYTTLSLSSYLTTIKKGAIEQYKNNFILPNSKKIPFIDKGEYIVNWYPAKDKGNTYNTQPIYKIVFAYDTLEKLSKENKISISKVQDNIDLYYKNGCDKNTKNCTPLTIKIGDYIDKGDGFGVDRSYFKDKYIFVGILESIGVKDDIKTLLADQLAGVYMHANILDNILRDDFIKKISDKTILILMFILSVITGITILGIKNPKISLSIGALYLLYFIIPFALFEYFNIWINLVYPELAVLLTYAACIGYQWVVVDKDKREVKRIFSNYIAPQILNEVLSDPSKVDICGNRKEITILFSDIRGFTSISERNTPEGVVAFLNEYFDAMVNEIMKTEGTVDKFIGDAIMAFWGAPIENRHHPEMAVWGAIGMINALNKLKRQWEKEGKDYPEINIGIGINTGEAVVGNVGSSKVKSYTVIGDTVNLASRLEGLNKNYSTGTEEDTNIIISEFTYKYVKDIFDITYLDEVKVKGKDIPVKIYKVHGIKEKNYE